MHVDIEQLRSFYASPLGQVAQRLLSAELRRLWPDVSGATLFGIGFATPFLEVFGKEPYRLGALMPAFQGVLCWPATPPFRAVLVDPGELPLPDCSADYALLAHGLEMTGDPRGLLREIWRILKPDGRVIFVVANRLSPWAMIDATPFGHGRPYSRSQLSLLLQDALFEPLAWRHALLFPPLRRLLRLQRYLGTVERAGRRFWPGMSGVFLVEARRQDYAMPQGRGLRRRTPQLGPILLPEAPRPAHILPPPHLCPGETHGKHAYPPLSLYP